MTIVIPRDEKYFDAVEALIQKEIPRIENPVKPVERPTKPESAKSDKPVRERTERKAAPQRDSAEKPAENTSRSRSDEPRDTKNTRGRRNDKAKPDNRRASGGRDNTIVGMGDHMPEFIALSFDERRAS